MRRGRRFVEAQVFTGIDLRSEDDLPRVLLEVAHHLIDSLQHGYGARLGIDFTKQTRWRDCLNDCNGVLYRLVEIRD